SPNFIEFMKNRSHDPVYFNSDLFELIKQSLKQLTHTYRFGCIIVLPSRTWLARTHWANKIKECLNKPIVLDGLIWQAIPKARQGELMNNAQRRENINLHMKLKASIKIPAGDILLFDDYMGSSATIKEAARFLRQQAM